MLSFKILSRNINMNNSVHKSIFVYFYLNKKNEYSSDSKSDEKNLCLKKDNKNNKSTDLNDLLKIMQRDVPHANTIKVGKSEEINRFKSKNANLRQRLKVTAYDEQIILAAKEVAATIPGDESKINSELLNKVKSINSNKSNINILNQSKDNKDKDTTSQDLMGLLRKMEVSKTKIPNNLTDIQRTKVKKLNQKSYAMLEQKEPILFPPVTNASFSSNLLEIRQQEKDKWDLLEEQELKVKFLHYPRNYFEEMIHWTDKKILWQFPINNEQGMESEKNVHFSEHVFMERHLKDWCPKKGPIKHFMELVCVGLSKNAFLTVQEKIDHINWYKEYFTEKETLLMEIGALPKEHSFTKISNENHGNQIKETIDKEISKTT